MRGEAEYEELVFERKGEKPLKGTMWVADGMVTVTTEDGRQKTTQVGGSPPRTLARMMLRELEGGGGRRPGQYPWD
jgi:hypothetical protein